MLNVGQAGAGCWSISCDGCLQPTVHLQVLTAPIVKPGALFDDVIRVPVLNYKYHEQNQSCNKLQWDWWSCYQFYPSRLYNVRICVSLSGCHAGAGWAQCLAQVYLDIWLNFAENQKAVLCGLELRWPLCHLRCYCFHYLWLSTQYIWDHWAGISRVAFIFRSSPPFARSSSLVLSVIASVSYSTAFRCFSTLWLSKLLILLFFICECVQ